MPTVGSFGSFSRRSAASALLNPRPHLTSPLKVVNLPAPPTSSEGVSYGSQKEQRQYERQKNDLLTRSHAHLRAAFRAIHPSRPAAYSAILKYADMILSSYLVSESSLRLASLPDLIRDSRPPHLRMGSISMLRLAPLVNCRRLISSSCKSSSPLMSQISVRAVIQSRLPHLTSPPSESLEQLGRRFAEKCQFDEARRYFKVSSLSLSFPPESPSLLPLVSCSGCKRCS
jgi:hypothetical protein